MIERRDPRPGQRSDEMPTLCTGPLSRPELLRRVGRLEQVGGVRLVELADGDGRGVRVLEFRTGSGFAFDILVDRTFDVWRCELNGIPLAWTSPVGVRGPWYYEPAGLGWSRTFAGGLVVTCGLDHAQVRARTRQRSTTAPLPPDAGVRPPRARGRLPGRLVGYGERWEGDECTCGPRERCYRERCSRSTCCCIDDRSAVGRIVGRILDTVENVGHGRPRTCSSTMQHRLADRG